jgi:hypothetical protein
VIAPPGARGEAHRARRAAGAGDEPPALQRVARRAQAGDEPCPSNRVADEAPVRRAPPAFTASTRRTLADHFVAQPTIACLCGASRRSHRVLQRAQADRRRAGGPLMRRHARGVDPRAAKRALNTAGTRTWAMGSPTIAYSLALPVTFTAPHCQPPVPGWQAHGAD